MTAYLCLSTLLFAQLRDPVLSVRVNADQEREIVAKLPGDVTAKLPMGRLTQEQGQKVLTLALVDDGTKKAGPAMFGKYERSANVLVFTPRFPLGAGQTYRADLHLPAQVMTLDYKMPAAAAKAPPKVVKIYPSADVLPANQLRFYIYFDRPMRGGKDIFKQFAIIDDKGNEVDAPWLIDEIWDEENNCLILYIHPGRIKWGVELRELMGPVLFENRSYSFVVRGELADLDGNKIGVDTIKKFRTTPEDRVRIELSDWKLSSPQAGTRETLTMTLAKIVDHRSLRQCLTVMNDKGQPVAGAVAIGKDERSWQFTPSTPWQTSNYRVSIDPDLEDVAGNTPARPFDMDLKTPKLPPQKLRMEFTPR